MKPFQGFPRRLDFTPIPNLFLNRLMPYIDNIAELKTTLFIFMSIYSKKGYPRFVTFNELLSNVNLMRSLKKTSKTSENMLLNALNNATKRRVILHLSVDCNSKREDIYFLNTHSDKQAVERLKSGELKLPCFESRTISSVQNEEVPDIFTLYEENIGILTPIIAEELKEAEKIFPYEWITDAITKAVTRNKRKWNYISAILERWSAEGRSSGTYRRDAQEEDPDRYIKGKYGHMVRRR
ncbi:MAG: DnaD domain protein [Dehalococcoidia bacterium]|nr:MAG: DnaD domain protein [Dehalococcoidia bacterium]